MNVFTRNNKKIAESEKAIAKQKAKGEYKPFPYPESNDAKITRWTFPVCQNKRGENLHHYCSASFVYKGVTEICDCDCHR